MGRPAPSHVDDLGFREVLSFPPYDRLEHGDLVALRVQNDTSGLTHGIHRFPAKYIPQVPAWALQNFAPPGTRVLDPFMGSGTTLVEGLRYGVESIGIDIDPLANMISSAKITTLNIDRLTDLAWQLKSVRAVPERQLVVPMPDIKNFGHWYTRDAWSNIQALLASIIHASAAEEERRFFLVVLSSILRWVSRADDQSQKTYVSGTLLKNPPEVLGTFWRQYAKAAGGMTRLVETRHPASSATILRGRTASNTGLGSGTIDLIVTSPPYLDSVDYLYNFMLEYFWLGPHLGVPDRAAFNQLRRLQVGTKTPVSAPEQVSVEIQDLARLEDVHPSRRRSALAYFENMSVHFAEASRVLRPAGLYVLVVGNSQSHRGALPVHDCLIRLAAAHGLRLEKAFGYRIRRHYMKFPRKGRGGIILLDWVIVLKKGDVAATALARLPSPWLTLSPESVAN